MANQRDAAAAAGAEAAASNAYPRRMAADISARIIDLDVMHASARMRRFHNDRSMSRTMRCDAVSSREPEIDGRASEARAYDPGRMAVNATTEFNAQGGSSFDQPHLKIQKFGKEDFPIRER